MKFKEGMTNKEKVEVVQRRILVHSMIYYEMNDSVISDKRFDKLCRLLVRKMEQYGPKKMAKTEYGYVFHDFDGSTGFDLIDRLSPEDRAKIERIAAYVLRLYKADQVKGRT